MTSLLIVDDDAIFCEVLHDSLKKKGFEIRLAQSVEQATELAGNFQPEYVLVDLKMPGGSGLTLIPKLLEIDPYTKIVVLTGYAGVATAIEAIKLGAIHYLSKPVDSEEIIKAFSREEGNPNTPIDTSIISVNQAEEQVIRLALERNRNNISASARELGIHRRTLQRKLDRFKHS